MLKLCGFVASNYYNKVKLALIDLDNFKAYNDRYSYARGSDLIKWMSEMLIAIKKEYGNT